MVKNFLDQKTRTCNFEARNDRTVTGAQQKAEADGNQSALKGSREIAFSGKQQASVPKEMLAASDTMLAKVEKAKKRARNHSVTLSCIEVADDKRWKKRLERRDS